MSVRYSLRLMILFLCFFWINGAEAATDLHPLAPPDVSSPRATLKTFLETVNDAVQSYKGGNKKKADDLVDRATECLNLEKEPPALRHVIGFYTMLYLKETLDRLELPPYDEIPDARTVRADKISSWTIPYTQITIAAAQEESSARRFLFSSDTVQNSEAYYEKVKDLPYTPDSGKGALLEHFRDSGSPVVSKAFIKSLPVWLKSEIHGEAAWQWIGLVLYFCIAAGMLVILYKYGSGALGVLDKRFHWNLKHVVGGLIFPVILILLSRAGLWFVVYGLHFIDANTYLPIAFIFLVISYVGWMWLIGAVCNRLSEALVSVAGFVPEGMDAQLIHLGFQIVAVIIIGVAAMYLGSRLGLPTYSLITGLGIGGLAVALAGREALSNIIGTVMIILDRPFKLGDYIILGGGERGEVTQVGLRSTRIRTRDDILISIPNAVIANEKMINESAPYSMSRIRIKLGVAYGCDLAEVERILLDIAEHNEAVLSHPNPRVRFRRFGDSALDLELLCWIDPPELKGPTIHHLNWTIYEEFRNKGIEIPFPQRDIHIRTSS